MTTLGRFAKSAHPPRQRSAGRPPVPLDRIIATALQIVDDEGADALSMRTLAQRLDSGTATLYRRFTGRADLIRHVVDRVLGEAKLPRPALERAGWQHYCLLVMRSVFEALQRHRRVAPLLSQHVPMGPNASEIRESVLAALGRGGFPTHLAARAYAALARYVLSFATQLSPTTSTGLEDSEDEHASAAFRSLDNLRFPATVAASASLPVPLEDEFAFGLELIVEGLASLHDRIRSAPSDLRPLEGDE